MSSAMSLARAGAAVVLVLLMAGCSATDRQVAPTPGALGPAAPTIPADKLVGKWGLGAFQRDSDRPRTEKEARAQCSNPYVISKGPNGGVMMHLADSKEREELFLKTNGGKTFLGPAGPAPMLEDREIVSMDDRIIIMRYMDPDVISRYGTSIYVRCGA